MTILKKIAVAGIVLMTTSAFASEEWKFKLSPYIWFAGLEGDVGPLKGVPPSHVDISASDAFSDTESSFMGILSGKKGRHGFFSDFFYSDLKSRETLDSGTSTKLTTTTETTMITLAYSYNVVSEREMNLDLLAGGRWWQIDADIKIKSLIPEANLSDDNTESWFDPLVGFRGHVPISDTNFFVTGGAGYGGFGINADHFYEISANMGYQWTNALATVAGYRKLDLDYDQNDFQYDAKQEGWQIGLTWSF